MLSQQRCPNNFPFLLHSRVIFLLKSKQIGHFIRCILYPSVRMKDEAICRLALVLHCIQPGTFITCFGRSYVLAQCASHYFFCRQGPWPWSSSSIGLQHGIYVISEDPFLPQLDIVPKFSVKALLVREQEGCVRKSLGPHGIFLFLARILRPFPSLSNGYIKNGLIEQAFPVSQFLRIYE